LAGDPRAIARAISLIEDGHSLSFEVVRLLYPHTGHAYRVGVTGPPGVGKSSIISSLISTVRGLGLTVGVISVDPSSPFTHGAVLGDRIRLAEHFLDRGVFIRSMGTRGHVGGVSAATLQASLVLAAAGKDVLFLETVGVGQSEVEIISIADTVVLALQPGSGDSIQALKAGVMEIPDVVVINKKDHPAALMMLNEIGGVFAMQDDRQGWNPPVVATDALTGEGIPELWAQVGAHRAWLEECGQLEERRGRQLEQEVFSLASGEVERRLARAARSDPRLETLLGAVKRRELDPLSAVRAILTEVFGLPPEE
jgi:LAO/AO transport system kinase